MRQAEHRGDVDHHRAGHVTRVPLGVRALEVGERQPLVGRHAGANASGLAVELHDLVEEQRLGSVGTVGQERRVQHRPSVPLGRAILAGPWAKRASQ